MTRRWLASGAPWTAMMVSVFFVVAPVSAQTSSGKASSRTNTWTAPKTSWGDPDLQGVWTSDSVRGIPMERPAELAGKTELSDEEFAAKVKRDDETRARAENAEGAFRNDGAWLKKSFRQTSLIVEPADGRRPPLTPESQLRAAPRDRGSFGEGPFYGPEDFTMYDRCITRGVVGSILPVVYGNGNRILQTPGQVVISYEMVHDTRVIPLDGRPHVGPKIRQYLGDSRGRWEGNTLVVETTNFTDQTSIGANGNGLRHSADMKLIERFTRVEADVLQVRGHDRRPEDVHETVEAFDSAHLTRGLPAPPVRVPRGQLHARRGARRRACRGQGAGRGRQEGDHPGPQGCSAGPRRWRASDPRYSRGRGRTGRTVNSTNSYN